MQGLLALPGLVEQADAKGRRPIELAMDSGSTQAYTIQHIITRERAVPPPSANAQQPYAALHKNHLTSQLVVPMPLPKT